LAAATLTETLAEGCNPGDARIFDLTVKQTMTATNNSIRNEVQQLDGFEVFDFVGGRVLDLFGFRPLRDYRRAEVADPIIRALVLRGFANEVESGCIHQFLYNCHSYDEAVHVKESLEVIGERRLAELLSYAIPLMSEVHADIVDESWKKSDDLPRNPQYQDIEADFREAYELMEGTFYDNYAAFIKANVDLFTEFDDPQKCQEFRDQFDTDMDPEEIATAQRTLRMLEKFWAWPQKRSWLLGLAFAGIVLSIVVFVIDFGLWCVTSMVAALIILLLYFSWRPKIAA
jgi:hypothetical protein